MLLRIPKVLGPEDLQVARHILANASFVDGRLSAGEAAALVKHNQEADRQDRATRQLDNLVMGALVRNPIYAGGALPQRVAAPFYARYRPGMAYGDHVDDPIMGPPAGRYRTDVAITVFLSGPEDYDGGELAIRTPFGDNRVKLPAGDAVMYPASSLHRVAPVTRGERLVAVTWVQSMVRDAARRELLHALNLAREKLLRTAPGAEETTHIDHVYVNLMRMWADL